MEEKIVFFVKAIFPTYRTISKCRTFTEAVDCRHDKINEGAISAHIQREVIKIAY